MNEPMKKIISVMLVAVFFVTSVLVLPPAKSAEASNGAIDIPDGNYYIVNAESGKFVGLENDSVKNGSRPVIKSSPTFWTVQHRNGHLQFSPHGNKNVTLEVQNSQTKNEARVQLYTNDWGYPCKEWELFDAGNGSVYIQNVNSGGVLDVSYGDIYQENAVLWHYYYNSTAAQKFRIVPADTATWTKYINQKGANVPEGSYKIKSIFGSRYLDVKDGLKGNEVPLQIWGDAGTPQQVYSVKQYSGKQYTITPSHSGRPLEVSASSKNNGARIQQYDWAENYLTKRWYFVETTPGHYWIVNANSLKVMDVKGGNSAEGTQVWQYALNGTNSQIFTLVKCTSKVEETIYAKAMATEGDTGSYYQNYYGVYDDWCAMYAIWVLQTSLSENGYSNSQINAIVPQNFSTTGLSNWYRSNGRYESFTSWVYSNIKMYKNSSNLQYTPKVGDLILVETKNGTGDGPDHTGIIIKVNKDGSFVSMEGNAGTPARVRSYTYMKSGNTWARSDATSVIVHGICNVDI